MKTIDFQKLNEALAPFSEPLALKRHDLSFCALGGDQKISFSQILAKIQSQPEKNLLNYAFPERGGIEDEISQLILKYRLNEAEKERLAALRAQRKKFKLTERQRPTQCARLVAELFLDAGSKIAYEELTNTFFFWNGVFWQALKTQQLVVALNAAAKKLGIYAAEYEPKTFKRQALEDLSYFFEPSNDDPECESFFEPNYYRAENEVRLNLQNGTLIVFASGERRLTPFDKKNNFTYVLPYAYDPNADCPIFKKFLERVQPCKDTQKRLIQHCANWFLRNGNGNFRLDKTPILLGAGKNGKSVFLNTAQKVLGSENCTNYKLSTLCTQDYARAAIIGKLVNVSSELGAKSEIDSDFFKTIASGEPIEFRHPYGRKGSSQNYPKMAFAANELPTNLEKSEGLYRRFDIFLFEEYISEEEEIKDLEKILESELPGILNWMLDELQELIRTKKLHFSKKVENACKDFKEKTDSKEAFLADLEIEKGEIPFKAKFFYEAYKSYCKEEGRPFPVGKRNFFEKIRQSGFLLKNGKDNQLEIFLTQDSITRLTNLPF